MIKANKIIPKCIAVVRAEGSYEVPSACPVCGAVHHPVLAVPCAGETTKEELDALRKKLEDLRQEQSRAEQTAAAAKARHEVAFAQLNAANDAANGDGFPSTVLIEITAAAIITAVHLITECSRISILSFVTALDISNFLSQSDISHRLCNYFTVVRQRFLSQRVMILRKRKEVLSFTV